MKKMLVIMLAVIMALSTAACGTVQPTTQTTPAPAVEVKPEVTPEVSESEPTEAPKEEPEATEVVDETPEVTEEVAEETESNSDGFASKANPVIDDIDFSGFFDGNTMEGRIIKEQAKYDSLKIFAISDKKVYILSDGDKFSEGENDEYVYWYYGPKDVLSMEKVQENSTFSDDTSVYRGQVLATEELYDIPGNDIPVGIHVKYEDGTEESITIYVTKE